MSSYINFMFKYLFQPENLSAELNRTAGATPDSPGTTFETLPFSDDNLSTNQHGHHLKANAHQHNGTISFDSLDKHRPHPLSGPTNWSHWLSAKCMDVARLLSRALVNSTSEQVQRTRTALTNFADFEHFLRSEQIKRQQHYDNGTTIPTHDKEANNNYELNSAHLTLAHVNPIELIPSNSSLQDQSLHRLSYGPSDQTNGSNSVTTNFTSLELLECYNQFQLHDYYKGYDIFIGLRIACTLSILFIVFILFVMYKTGCSDGEGTSKSRSQLRLASASTNKRAQVRDLLDVKKARAGSRHPCNCHEAI